MDLNEDIMLVLCCEITIGDENRKNPMIIDNPIVFTEVKHIEINESFKELIGTARVLFPKGSIYKDTIISTVKNTDPISAEIMQDGWLIEKKTNYKRLEESTFKIGQRIRIKIGYNGLLKTMFNGYIVKYNCDREVELDCENMAYKLKLKQAPVFSTPPSGASVQEICEGQFNLLKDTGFKLHSNTKKSKIMIGKVSTVDNYTVADILNDWSRFSVYSYLQNDTESDTEMPAICVGRIYSAEAGTTGLSAYDLFTPYKLRFDYHVVDHNIKSLKIDPKFLAVSAKAVGLKKDKFFGITVRLNPEYDPDDKSSEEFQILDATQISKKDFKISGGAYSKGKDSRVKVDLSTYTVVPYTSVKMGITEKELTAEAIDYFKSYNLNGIEGSVTILGDYALTTGAQVELIDNRNPSKNGVYLVEEVTTTFGIDGYKQKLTIPHKIKGKITYADIKSNRAK